MSKKDTFKDKISNVKIPILILDNKWHRIFGKMNPTPEISRLEKELTELVKEQGKLNNENNELQKLKSNLCKSIVDNMDGIENNSDKSKEKTLNDNKRLINDINERLGGNEDRLIELPREIDQINKQLMIETMSVCYDKLQSNTSEIESIAEWIQSIRIQLKKNVVKKQDLEIYNSELYSYMHNIFGPEVMEIFDMKYVPKTHKLPNVNGKEDVKNDTDSDGNRLVD